MTSKTSLRKRLKTIIIEYTKSNQVIYTVYYYLGTFIVNLLKLFVKPEGKLFLFISYGGKQYDDSPKEIYEYMLRDERFDGYKFVWAFREPDKFILPKGITVKTDTFKYYLTALKARVWITNVAVERGLNFKGKNTLYFCTWHGTPIKKIGSDLNNKSGAFVAKSSSNFDLFCAQGEFDAEIFARVFNLKEESVAITGLPRNDSLAIERNKNEVKTLRKKLGLPDNKRVILYAPTFREYEGYSLNPPIDLKKWESKLGNNYILLMRAHHAVLDSMTIPKESAFVYDVSNYHSLNELMVIADLLISDYSSIFFDYSILGRPMFCFAYDYEEYRSKRGVYFDVRQEILGGTITEDELLYLVENTPYKLAVEKTIKFREKYVDSYGDATKKSVDLIYDHITRSGDH